MYSWALRISLTSIFSGVGTNFRPRSINFIVSGGKIVGVRLTVKGEMKIDRLISLSTGFFECIARCGS